MMIYTKDNLRHVHNRINDMPLKKFKKQIESFYDTETELLQFVNSSVVNMAMHAPKELGCDPFTEKQREAVLRTLLLLGYQLAIANIYAESIPNTKI